MSRFPDLFDPQKEALFEIVEAFQKHDWEGKATTVIHSAPRDRQLGLLVGGSGVPTYIDTDFDTLRVLDQEGYIAFREETSYDQYGKPHTARSLILKKLASDYYNWCHSPPWYKPVAEIWFSLAPNTRSAIFGSAATFVLGLLALLIRACLSQ